MRQGCFDRRQAPLLTHHVRERSEEIAAWDAFEGGRFLASSFTISYFVVRQTIMASGAEWIEVYCQPAHAYAQIHLVAPCRGIGACARRCTTGLDCDGHYTCCPHSVVVQPMLDIFLVDVTGCQL